MGNTLLDENKKDDPVEIYEQWIEQNPDLVGREILAHNKLFETDFFKYCENSIKMEVFFRRDNTPLQEYLKAFQIIQGLVERYKCMHIMPMRILELKDFKDKQMQKYQQNFAIAIRQFLHMTLEQRLQGRPCLSEEEKIWIIYQIIFSVYTIHQIFNIYHGNIRTSNFLITTYHYLILTDFASYKPNYILQDTEQGLSEFRLFYGSSVEKCNLAPEKMAGKDNLPSSVLNSKRLFNGQSLQDSDTRSEATKSTSDSAKKMKKNAFDEDSDAQKQINKLKMMDMFSLGLTILEVINDGKPSMSYEQLLKMKKEGFNLNDKINQSVGKLTKGKEEIENILTGLLKQNPEERWNITRVLQKYVAIINLQTSALFWCCLSAFNKTSFSSGDLRVHLIYSIIRFIETEIRQTSHKFIHKPPRCLSGFNSLKIFVEMIEKKIIFSPKVDDSVLFERLLKHFEKIEDKEGIQEPQEEILYEDSDQRRKFFINPAKKGKIAKRLSFVSDFRPKDKELCPPNYSQVQKMIDLTHKPIKLTQLGLKASRLQELLKQYKSNQGTREYRIKDTKYYKNCQIIIKIIFSCVRSCKYVASKLLAIQMMSFIGRHCSDQILLKVLLPYNIHLTQDNDITVAREAFFGVINLFYNFIDPFHCEQDIHYFELVMEFFINIIKQSKLRLTLFSHFKEVYYICEWMEIHYKKFNKEPKIPLSKIIEVIKVHYGSYSREQIKMLLNNNIPEHILTDMFEFYISLINTDRLEGLKLSVNLARNISVATHKHILDAFDSCIESGLDQYGIGLFYSIQYFTLRKSTTHFIIRKIAPHIINPSKWIRDEAINFVRMCLEEYPPTKSYFFFKEIFQAPFPLKPEDIEDEILLPVPLKDSDIDLREKKLKIQKLGLTESLFNDYLKTMKLVKSNDKSSDKVREEQVVVWNQSIKQLLQSRDSKSLNFENYIKRQLELLYEYNLLYYILNMNAKFPAADKEKQQEKKYPELILAFKKIGRVSMDLSSIDHEKKELFQQFEGTINSSFEKLLAKKNRENGEVVTDKIRLAESIIIIGEVLCKFQMFKIKPIPKLGTYIRQPTMLQKLSRPKGTLVSEIFEHADTITCLEKVADQFFLSGSADGTLKIFDSKKIQMNVTTCSQASLQIKGDSSEEKVKISSICAFENTYTAVVGSNKGHIRIYPIERLPGNRSSKNDEIMKYSVNSQIEKIITFSNQLKNECFCYITGQGNLGIQDIRLKSKSMGCNIGRERGMPRSICATSRNSILVGTIDGYIINFDIRYNIISSVLQLYNDKETLPITNIYPCPLAIDQREQMFAFTYPSKHYEFSYFNIHENSSEFAPIMQFTSSAPEEIVTTPYLCNRTSEEQFKLSKNGLIWRKHYDQLSDFHKNFNIFDYLSDPLTKKESKIREIWMDNCKKRYNQISSMYTRKCLPFLEYINSGILTNCNSTNAFPSQLRNRSTFTLLTEKRENRDYNDIERILTGKPNNSHRIMTFNGEENKDYYTCCRVLPQMVVVGCRNSLLKIFM